MIRKFKCRDCNGHGSIPYRPPGPQTETISERCPRCDGQGFVQVDDADEIKEAPPDLLVVCRTVRDQLVNAYTREHAHDCKCANCTAVELLSAAIKANDR